MNCFRRFYGFFAKPFTNNFFFLLVITLLVCISDAVGYFFYFDDYKRFFGLYMALHGYIMCYGIALIASILKGKSKIIYEKVFIILAYINFIIDASVHITCKTRFNIDMVYIVLGTNVQESAAFIDTYFSWQLVGAILSVSLLLILFKRFKSKIDFIGGKTSVILFLLLIFSFVCVISRKSQNWDGVFLNKITLFLRYQSPPDLKQYFQSPNVMRNNTNDSPDYVVMVIGESFSKSHSSLYGYKKETNPFLSAMVEDSSLVVYTNATAPATSTINVFKSLMSSYKQEYGDKVNWFECTTLLEILKLSGFSTTWISNQSPSGVYDNIIAKYADLCDSTHWIGSRFKGIKKTDYDGEVVQVLHSMASTDYFVGKKNFIIIHLMGSHQEFKDRYPSEYDSFQEKDYMDVPKHQRSVLAQYDNSVLYNDTVIKNIMDFFTDKEAIVFYFSDHSLDLYNSSDNYFGHARVDNEISVNNALNIPFVIYASPIFMDNYAQTIEKLQAKRDSTFKTDMMMDMILDMLDICVDYDQIQ